MTLRSIDRILASSTLCYFCRLRYFSIHPYHFAICVPIIGEYDLFIIILPLVPKWRSTVAVSKMGCQLILYTPTYQNWCAYENYGNVRNFAFLYELMASLQCTNTPKIIISVLGVNLDTFAIFRT